MRHKKGEHVALFTLRERGEYFCSATARIRTALAFGEAGYRVFLGMKDLLLNEVDLITTDAAGWRYELKSLDCLDHPVITVFSEESFQKNELNDLDFNDNADDLPVVFIASASTLSQITIAKEIGNIMHKKPVLIVNIDNVPAGTDVSDLENLMRIVGNNLRYVVEKDTGSTELTSSVVDFVCLSEKAPIPISGADKSSVEIYGEPLETFAMDLLDNRFAKYLRDDSKKISTIITAFPNVLNVYFTE